jgi:hypothetical protein
MISLVQRAPCADECDLQNGASLIDAGAHFTFLQGGGVNGPARKATTDACKLTLGQLRYGGVWLTPINEIDEQLAVAEGIETALSVQQITSLPTVAALSAAGMRSLRWLPQVRRLWIAADNDEVGRGAAEALLARAACRLEGSYQTPRSGEERLQRSDHECVMSKMTGNGFIGSADSGLEEESVNHEVEAASILPAIYGSAKAESNEGATESDPFAGNAEDHTAKETRIKNELFKWADSVLGLNETELELELDDAAKRFGRSRAALRRIIKARRSEKFKANAKAERSSAEPNDQENNVKYYSHDFKVSDRGVYARKFDDHGHPFWDRICTTRIDLLALTRDRREENWGTYIVITNRDGGKKKLAIPHALTAA